MMKKIILLFCLLATITACSKKPLPKNIILFIGDGMGIQQVTAAKVIKGSLAMERCPITGMVTTWSANALVTDSAASVTAIASGVKTKNGTLSIGSDGKSLKTVLEYAEERNKATGLVSTCGVTHATPAGFAAHVTSRSQYIKIAEQLAASGVDVLFGGGLNHFTPTNNPSLPLLQEKMIVVFSTEEFKNLGTPEKAAALLYPNHPPYAADREISLAELTRKAIEILAQDKDGFFLMVEGSQIDWAGHLNNEANVVAETVDFDDAVGIGLDFAEENSDTLVIITADHETGGFALLGGSIENKTVDKTGFVDNHHTASMVPVFAYGPGSEAFSGILDNTDIGKTMIQFIQTSE
ncbi:MAG: alkaline phosphatase [Victivallales bacterium]|nr:alkaline phosphatase [Victivallales bacterium]